MKDGIFQISDISIVVTDDLGIHDCSSGLVLDKDIITIKKEGKEEFVVRKGTQNTSYSANSIVDNNRSVTIVYLPTADAVATFENIRNNKLVFAMDIKNDSEPKFRLVAPRCIIAEEPELKVNSKSGVDDYTILIKALDSTLVR